MGRYIVTRLLQIVVAVWGVATLVFVLMRLSGDPVALFVTEQTTPAEREEIRRQLGLDQPLPVQYVKFLSRAAVGDFGNSLRLGQPALGVVLERFSATVELAVVALVLSVAVGIPAGVFAAAKRGSGLDHFTMVVSVLGQGIPTFILAILLIWLFAVQLHWLPVGERGTPEHLILPAVTLAAYSLARLARLTRSAMLEVLGQEYVRTARSKGLAEWLILRRHALRNAAIPVVTTIGVTLAQFIGGAVITETIFAWPGVGRLLVQAVGQRDYPIVQAAVVITGLSVVMGNLLTDVLCAVLDPRIRHAH
jgi:peptide/nickel transport system permease protein